MLAGAIVVALVAGLGWGVWWWRHPSLLANASPSGNALFMPMPVGRATAYVTVAIGSDADEVIELRRITARFKVNTAKATTAFHICRPHAGSDPIGALTDISLSEYCARVTPVTDGTRFHFSTSARPADYIVLTITPTVPGQVHVDQITFDYARSWRHLGQRGTETSAQDWRLRVTP